MSKRRFNRVRFMWNCPWRIEYRRVFEFWERSQFGPFYILHLRRETAVYDEGDDD